QNRHRRPGSGGAGLADKRCIESAALNASALVSLGIPGGTAAKTGGAPILPGVAGILIWFGVAAG
ncbi:hypothetical protein DMW52_01245, partial [Serratia marcescens]